MKSYKLTLLLKSNLKKEEKEKLFSDIKKWLGEVKSEKVEVLGEKKLAYPVKHERSGEYTVINFEAEKINSDIAKKLLIQDFILRHLLVRV